MPETRGSQKGQVRQGAHRVPSMGPCPWGWLSGQHPGPLTVRASSLCCRNNPSSLSPSLGRVRGRPGLGAPPSHRAGDRPGLWELGEAVSTKPLTPPGKETSRAGRRSWHSRPVPGLPARGWAPCPSQPLWGEGLTPSHSGALPLLPHTSATKKDREAAESKVHPPPCRKHTPWMRDWDPLCSLSSHSTS